MPTKQNIFAAMLSMLSIGNHTEYAKHEAMFRQNRSRKKKGGGRGGFHPPRHARAKAHKRAFGGICGPRIDATQFFNE